MGYILRPFINGTLQVRNRIYRRVFGPEWAGLSGLEKTSYTVTEALSRIFGRRR